MGSHIIMISRLCVLDPDASLMLRTAIEAHPLTEGSMRVAGPGRIGRVGFANQLRKSIFREGNRNIWENPWLARSRYKPSLVASWGCDDVWMMMLVVSFAL